jgi:ubiquinone/menaquinone biosynthesis C-methylase UbiE
MTASSSDDSSSYLLNVQGEINRLGNNVERMWPKEKRNLIGFGLGEGMSVLELGSGPGFFTEKLATLVPNGSITCIEPMSAFVEYAHGYLKDRVRVQHRIIEATVEDMELPEGSFDFAIARALYGFVADPLEVTRKLMRCLKPGGRLVLTDFDGELPPLTVPAMPEVRNVVNKQMEVQARIGADITIGRKLRGYLKEAGFTELDLDSLVFHSGDEGARACYPQFAPDRFLPLLRAGILEEQEFEAFRTTTERFASSSESFYMRVVLMACGTRPRT